MKHVMEPGKQQGQPMSEPETDVEAAADGRKTASAPVTAHRVFSLEGVGVTYSGNVALAGIGDRADDVATHHEVEIGDLARLQRVVKPLEGDAARGPNRGELLTADALAAAVGDVARLAVVRDDKVAVGRDDVARAQRVDRQPEPERRCAGCSTTCCATTKASSIMASASPSRPGC